MKRGSWILLCGICMVIGTLHDRAGWVSAAEPEFKIVKYGKVSVKSTLPDTKVYIDDTYTGVTDLTVDNVMVGERTISLRHGQRTLTGVFTVQKNEVLRLEGRFDENKIVDLGELERVERAEAERKRKAEAARPVEQKKPPVVEQKKVEVKAPEEDPRDLHRTLIKIYFDNLGSEAARVQHTVNPKVISKLLEKKNKSGKYYRTKQGVPLCDTGPCEMVWSVSFTYTDEKGKEDSFVLVWKETVFSGATPDGTSKRMLEWCLNGACNRLTDTDLADKPQEDRVERYRLNWSRYRLTLSRDDVK